MNRSVKVCPEKEATEPNASRSHEHFLVIEQYVIGLREIIKKLSRKLN